MTEAYSLADRMAELRAAFDQSFAGQAVEVVDDVENFLDVRIGGDAYALDLGEIRGLHADRKIVPLPSEAAGLLGVTRLGSEIVPVFDLCILLGYPAQEGAMRWLVQAGRAPTVAFALNRLEGHLRIPGSGISTVSAEASHGHVRGTANLGDRSWPILRIGSLIALLEKQVGPSRSS